MMGKKNKYDEYMDNPSNEFFDFLYDWLECVAQSVILVVLLFCFFLRPINVSGKSMYSTLHDGDKVVVLKFNYKPKSGDVVVIKRGQYLNEPLIKRVIATEGQSLAIDFNTGTVIVDNKILNEEYIWESTHLQGDNDIPSVIPKGYCFVMGDNRNHSTDSRFKEVGLIQNENVVGRAMFIFYPFNRLGFI